MQQASSSTVNSLVKPRDNKDQSKSNSALPSTPIRTSSHPDRQLRTHNKPVNHHRPMSRRNDPHHDLNGSRTTNTSTNVSPSFNDNNSRTVLLSSDDIRSPHHHQSKSRHRQPVQINTDSTAEYDEVASHSTVDDSTPQTTSESASMSELPSESRFKTFVKKKKNKLNAQSAITNSIASINNRYNRQEQLISEDTDDPETSTRLLDDRYSDESQMVRPSNGCSQDQLRGTLTDSLQGRELPNGVDSSPSTHSDTSQEGDRVTHDIENSRSENDDLVNHTDDVDDDEDDDDEEVDDHDDDDDEEEEEDCDDDEAEEGVYDLSDGHVTGVQIT